MATYGRRRMAGSRPARGTFGVARNCHHGRMLRGLVGFVAAAVLSVFTALLLNGRYRAEGEVVLRLSENHGIHRGDILVAGGWLIGVMAIAVLLLERPRD